MATRQGNIGSTVTFGIKFYVNGVLVDPFSINDVDIYDAATGGTLIAQATPTRNSIGYYQVEWTIPTTLTPATLYDEWTWVAESGMASKSQRYSFEIVATSESVPAPAVVRADVVLRDRPEWEFLVGIRNVQDVGNGSGLLLSWGRALPEDSDKVVHYNIYWSTTRQGVFSSTPYAVTVQQQAVINVTPGTINYFAVRATEFDVDEFDIQELTQIGVGLHQYPESLTLENSIDAYGGDLEVEHTIGYPDSGFLLVGEEIIQYTNQTDTTFEITETQRGAFSTAIQEHFADETVRLYQGVEEQNTVIFQEVAAWHQNEGEQQSDDAIGTVNADEDGYRAVDTDVVTTDLSANDDNFEDFPGYDYCGYHRPSLQSLFSGDCVNSYVGGEFNGGRGFFFTDRNLARLDAMLQVTGEPVVLLKRKWTGRRCRCTGLRREHPRSRCAHCFGTGFDGGYDRYVNTRPISEASENTQGYIMIRVNPYSDDLELVGDQGLRQPVEITAWTITIPTIKDRDVLVRFAEDGAVEFVYEALDVTRNKLFFGESGKQEFRMRRMDKTDELYTFDFTI